MSGLLPRTPSGGQAGDFENLNVQTLTVSVAGFINALTVNSMTVGDLDVTSLTTGTINGDPNLNIVATTASVGGDTIVTRTAAQTLTTKTLTAPIISTISNTGTLTLPTSTDTLVGRATTDTLTNKTLTSPIISTISNTGTLTLPTSTDTLVGRATTDTLTNKTLTLPIISSISNSGTVTIPTGTDTLVARSTTDTLANKILLTASCKFADADTNSKSIIFDSPSATASTSTTFRTAQSVDRVITFPNATDTVVLAAATQSLTNKTLTSPVITNGGTLTLPSTNTTLVGRDTTDTLTNKTLTLPVIASISNGAALLTLPSTSTTIIGTDTTDVLSNKSFTDSPSMFSGKKTETSGTQSTTDASTVTLVTVAFATSNTVGSLDIRLFAYCTAGANANLSCAQRMQVKVLNVAGTLSQGSINNSFSNSFATGLGVAFSGTNAQVQVTGIASNDIRWKAYVMTYYE